MKILVLCIALMGMAAFTSCKGSTAHANAADGVKIEMQLNENYDDTEPFVNEKLFCVSRDLEKVTAKCEIKLEGTEGTLEIKNNQTNQVLWSNTWEGTGEFTALPISLNNLKKEEEYVVCFTGTGIRNAKIEMNFENAYVQEREKPLK